MRRRNRPPSAASTTLAILSVSTSMISSPGLIVSPSETCQAESLPSFIERPHFGIRIGVISAMSVLHRLADGLGDVCGRRDVAVVKRGREEYRRMGRRLYLLRRLKRVKGYLRHGCRYVGGDRTARVRLIDADQPSGRLDAFQDRVHVDG